MAFRLLCFECGRQQGRFVRVRAGLFQVTNDAKQNEETSKIFMGVFSSQKVNYTMVSLSNLVGQETFHER